MKTLSLVTCLYDLVKRGSAGHRTIDWIFANSDFVLGQDRELVIFTDPELEPELLKRRGSRRTKILPVPFEKLLRSDRVVAAQRGALPRNASRTKDTPIYVQLMWARYAMLEVALDVTTASHVGWIDLAITHVGKPPPDGVDVFADPPDAPRVHVLRMFSKSDVDAPDYWHAVRGHLAGGLVVGARERMRDLAREFWRAVDRAASMGLAPLDEGLLSYVVGQRLSTFSYSYGDYEDILRNHDEPRGGDAHRKWIVDDARSRGLPDVMERSLPPSPAPSLVSPPEPTLYVVSLASAVARRDRMVARLTDEGLPFVIVEAHGSADPDVLERAGEAKSDEELRKIACLISHLRALQMFLATPATEAIICEDDVRPQRGFARRFREIRENIPDDVPLVGLGYLVWRWDGFLWAGKDRSKHDLATIGPDFWGTQMYLVRRAWAAECVARFGVRVASIETRQIRTAELITRESAGRGGLVAYPPLAIEDLTGSIISPGPTNHAEVVEHWDTSHYVP